MKRKLTAKEYTYVASMLFGLFFGAGNLIFPVHLGQMAGSNVWQAILGLLITGVGLPLLGVDALGISQPPLRDVLHLRAVSDHWAVFRHSPLRDDVIHRGT